ncbi:diacylglycerol kinase [Motiliproteus coralliicola]|uniref:Diacylglycerol kinase n=1 Tax=Motiliproteus coralliicola TaxID=2283196 RepID=A0A369WV70_9GAMM|nr:diacylglycerol kinase [Motiliproteus coralliicola]RDE25023.1 diacylglycerol kinase [Motiliproteus coralliicola]
MSKPGRSGLSRIYHAAIYSWQGFRAAWKHEAAFRQELILTIILLPIGYWIAADAAELALLYLPVGLVLLMELMNSAIEAVVDRVGEERHPLSGRAKDIGSAAVFLALVLLAVIWGLVAFKNWPLW